MELAAYRVTINTKHVFETAHEVKCLRSMECESIQLYLLLCDYLSISFLLP